MSRFADPTATARMSLGKCQCPGTPHPEDWIELRTELGVEEAGIIGRSTSLETLVRLIVSWNLQDKTGAVPPTDEAHVNLLFGDFFETFDAWLNEHVKFSATLPNASAAPSQGSSPMGRSPIPTPTNGSSPTTPFSSPAGVSGTTTSGTPPPSS